MSSVELLVRSDSKVLGIDVPLVSDQLNIYTTYEQ